MKRYATAILGAGPAGIGLLVCAAQRGRLERLLGRGLALVEQGRTPGCGTLGRYDLNSDSPATSFVECVERGPAAGPLRALAGTAEARALIARRDRHVPLVEVAAFLRLVGHAMRDEIERRPESACLFDTRARSVSRLSDGSWAVDLAPADGGPSRLVANSVVFALGGHQVLDDVLAQRVAGLELRAVEDRVVLTDSLLTHGGVERSLPGARPLRIVVIGDSHSAFSAAWALCERLPEGAVADGGIVLLQRKPPRIFYPTPQAAREDEYSDFTDDDICPHTGRVHRLGGLRGDGRELWRRVTGRTAPAAHGVQLLLLADDYDRARRLIEEADVVVPAFGYRPRTLPVFDELGRPLRLRAEAGGDLVSDDGRVVPADAVALPRMLGIGMAAGFRPSGEPSFRGQVNGVWLCHNDAGERVLEALEADSG